MFETQNTFRPPAISRAQMLYLWFFCGGVLLNAVCFWRDCSTLARGTRTRASGTG